MNSISLLSPRGDTLFVAAAGSGPTLFLLHGFPLDHRMWLPQLDALAHSYHLVAMDLRGFGQSSLGQPPYSIADLADDVEFVRSHLAAKERITLCGLSLGGYVGLEYWRRHGRCLSGLVLANTKPEADSAEARSMRHDMAAKATEQGAWEAVAGMLSKLLNPELLNSNTEVLHSVEHMLRGCNAAAIAAAQQAMANRADFLPQLLSIHTPTLVISGEFDLLAPPDATRKWAAVIPNSQFKMIPNAAHLTPLEAPLVFNQCLVEFLQTLPCSDSPQGE